MITQKDYLATTALLAIAHPAPPPPPPPFRCVRVSLLVAAEGPIPDPRSRSFDDGSELLVGVLRKRKGLEGIDVRDGSEGMD